MSSMATRKPLFISLEGLDGCGKTSQIDRVADFCRNHNQKGFILTREPGGTEVGERIRHLLLEHASIDARSELLLIFAARVQHLKTIIEPALTLGQTVICDRYLDATYAYQGYGRGLPLSLIDELVRVLCIPLPDLTLFFDVPVKLAAARRKGRPIDRIEAEGTEFFERVRKGYYQLAENDPERVAIIPAHGTLAAVGQAVDAVLKARC